MASKNTSNTFTLPSANILKIVLESVKDLITDANLDLSTNGISMQSMDSSHVSLVALLMDKEMFTIIDLQKSVTLGIKIPSLINALKFGGVDNELKMNYLGDTVDLLFSNSGETVKKLGLKLQDIDSDHLGIPPNKHPFIFEVNADAFNADIQAMATCGVSTLQFIITKEKITVRGDGDEMSPEAYLVPGKTPYLKSFKFEPKDPSMKRCQVTLAMRYILFFMKAVKVSNKLTISLNPDMPAEFSFQIQGPEEKFINSKLIFYLAPKVEDEEEEESRNAMQV